MNSNKHIEDMIKNPINKSLIGYSYKRSSNIKTYFINIKSHSNVIKIFIKEEELAYFGDIIEQVKKDIEGKKLLLKKARENREKFREVTKGEVDIKEEVEEVEEVDVVEEIKELEDFKEDIDGIKSIVKRENGEDIDDNI